MIECEASFVVQKYERGKLYLPFLYITFIEEEKIAFFAF
jgi:hypothetical protein